MKRMRFTLLLVLLLGLLSVKAAAADPGEFQWEALDADGVFDLLPPDARDEAESGMGAGIEAALREVFHRAVREADLVIRDSVRSLTVILAVLIAAGMLSSLGEKGSSASLLAGVIAVSLVTLGDANSLISLGTETISRLDTFSKALLPTVAAACTAGGGTGAGAVCAVSMLFSDILLTAVNRFFLPLVYAYMGASIGAAAGGKGLESLAGIIKSAVKLGLSAILTVFLLFLSLTKAFAGAADAAVVKAAKLAISTAVPVVGGIIADAADAVTAGAIAVRGALGIGGAVGIISLCALPFLRVGVRYLLYKVTAALGGAIAPGRLAGLLESLAGGFGMVLAILGANALLVLLSLISAVRLTVG